MTMKWSSATRIVIRFAVGASAAAVLLMFASPAVLRAGRPGTSSEEQAKPSRADLVRAERQPAADLGDGHYRNPVMAGDFPDPSIVRVGKDYYLTSSPGTWAPRLMVWHSRDLVNWEPLGCAVSGFSGDIWAPDLVYYQGLFYLYFPARVRDAGGKFRQSCFVTTAADPRGPWREPVDLNVSAIDPGHMADDAGNRFLYVDGGRMVRLTPDGFRTEGDLVNVYDGWPYPSDWTVECKCLESPKLFSRSGHYYLVSAQGGTAGPSTSHMIVIARSKSPTGPWENSPRDPFLRTASRGEKWWSQGHGTILEAEDGSWWVIYHAYENGYRTLGRSTLLMPVEWTKDGWPIVPDGADPAGVLPKPPGGNVGHGLPLSDDFKSSGIGPQWKSPAFPDPSALRPVAHSGGGRLRIEASGDSVGTSNMICLDPVNHSYEVSVAVRVPPGAEAGLFLYYDDGHFAGVAAGKGKVFTYIRGKAAESSPAGHGPIYLKIRNDEHDVSFFHSSDGLTWNKFEGAAEMSGFHRESLSGWETLRVALSASGSGEVEFADFRYSGYK